MHKDMATIAIPTAISKSCSAEYFLEKSMEYMDEPIIMQTMKLANTMPRGGCPGPRTGVHWNTKIYMLASKRD